MACFEWEAFLTGLRSQSSAGLLNRGPDSSAGDWIRLDSDLVTGIGDILSQRVL